MKHRLQKLLAQANLGSRRATEDFITAGRIMVNGEVAVLGSKADPETDVVTLDGEKLNLQTPPIYVAYYKPVNVISSMERQYDDDRPTVRDMVPLEGHLFSVGRLDVESEGLIILTNDGDLTNTLTHPRYEHTKTYQVTVYGTPDSRTLERWERGVMLSEDDGTETQTAPCYVELMRREGETALLKIVMTEGRNRQIRRVAAMLGHPVKLLVRTHIGRYGLGKLKRGDYTEMSDQDLRLLTTPATELEEIQKIKAQTRNNDRRARFMALSTASPEQIEEVKRNKPAPAPRPGKKYAERRDDSRDSRGGDRPRSFNRGGEGRGSDDRPRRPYNGDRRSGPPDGKRPGSKPAFRSRLMLDETGASTPGARRHGQSDTPEGFRSRLGETDRRPRQGDGGDDRPRKVYGKSETPSNFRSRLGEADRPARRTSSDNRAPRRDGDSRPPRRDDDRPRSPRPAGDRSASGDRPRSFNRDGDSRPPRSDDGRPRDGRPTGERSASSDRPRSFNRDGDSRPARPPRRDGDSRPPRRDDDRPRSPRPAGERSASSDRPRSFNRDGDSRPARPPRRDGDSRPPRREGDDRPRSPRPAGERSASSDRPRSFNRDGDSRPARPPRRDGDSRPPRREGDDRPRSPRPTGERSASGDRPRSFNRDGDSRPARPPRRDGDSRPPRRDGDDRPRSPRPTGERSASGDRPRSFNRDGDSRPARPPRRDGDSRPPRREGDDRPRSPRPAGDRSASGDRPRSFNRDGDSRPARPPRRDGDSRPPRREGDDRPRSPRPAGDRPVSSGERSSRPPRRDGDSRPPRREGDDRPRSPRPAGTRPANSGERSSRPPRSNSGDRPVRPARPPRRDGDSSAPRAPRKRKEDEE